jgi:hypothetical protein
VPVATPSQLAQSVAETSGWRCSQAEFSSAKAVQHAMARTAHATPRMKSGTAPVASIEGACDVASIIKARPAAVSTRPGNSAGQRRPAGLPSTMTHSGMVPMMSVGTSVPASRIASTRNQ